MRHAAKIRIMKLRIWIKKHKLLSIALVFGALALTVPEVRLAFTIGSGIGLGQLQDRIETIQSRAINNQVSDGDKTFLESFYRVLAYGAGLTLVLPESARLMHHYLDSSGEQTSLAVELLTESPRVANQMGEIRSTLQKQCSVGQSQKSSRFDMGHLKPLDSHFALYFGTISGKITASANGEFEIRWTAEMPWKWPTYKDIKAKHGTFYAEIIPFPNAMSLLDLGPPMFLPNALGGELEKQGLAKSFQTITSWQETLNCKVS